ncbi:MAG: SUMF1/EgtB/PvdO family nonheme iron enzyme, partial [Gammaproteobacteria bacterium]|nr:SUMF1/EgtB/PvdO family nonheme iron enzyme [Gammaproteobacteria bacterium]
MDMHSSSSCSVEQIDQAWVEGAEFIMGDDSTYKEEGPAHSVSVSGFWMDAHEVTNAQFAKFVEET